MINGPFSVSKAFSEGWKLTKKHWLIMIGLMLGLTIVTLIITLFQGTDHTSIRYYIFNLITLVIGVIFNAGYYKMYLVAADGEEPEFNLFGKCLKRAFPLFIQQFIYGMGVFIGICLLIVPGIWFAVRFGFGALSLLDDEECGIIESFRRSFKLTSGYALPLTGMVFLSFLIIIAGLILFVIGVFPATVWITFAFVAAFRMLQNKQQDEVVVIEENAI
ncbi:MAG: hypothetical protein RR346_04375 [Bacteroidales bacterium]